MEFVFPADSDDCLFSNGRVMQPLDVRRDLAQFAHEFDRGRGLTQGARQLAVAMLAASLVDTSLRDNVVSLSGLLAATVIAHAPNSMREWRVPEKSLLTWAYVAYSAQQLETATNTLLATFSATRPDSQLTTASESV